MKKEVSPKIIYSLSMMIFGTLGLFTRHIFLHSGELALYRAILALLFIVIYLLTIKQKIDFESIKKEIPLLLLSGIALGMNWVLLFEAYRYTTISIATLSYYFAPVIVTIVCPFLFHEELTKKQIICFCMSTLGLIMIIGCDKLQDGQSQLLGILFGLGAAVFYAGVVILNKTIKNVAGIQRTFLQFLSSLVILIPYVLLTENIQITDLDQIGWICLVIVGIIHTGFTYCLYFSSLKELTGQEASLLSYIDPLMAVFVSVCILGESMSFIQMLGGILILGFTFINERKA